MNGPYAASAEHYLAAGWSPITLPYKEKTPAPTGYTGAAGKYVDEAQIKEWSGRGRAKAGKLTWLAATGNVALRLPPSVLGVDCDFYEGKAGRKTIEAHEKRLGKLPDTFYTSSKEDGSGIRLFRIPPGLSWPGELQGGGVELVRWDHRYAIVSPSIHDKTGAEYRWWFGSATEGELTGEFPAVDELPELPAAWIKALTAGKKWVDRPASEMDEAAVRAWLDARNGGEACTTMARTLTKFQRLLRTAGDDGGAHDAGRDGAWALVGDAHAGHAGVRRALTKLRATWHEAVDGRRGKRLAAEEWTRFVMRGVQKVAAEGEADEDDLCALVANAGGNGSTSDGSADGTWSGGGSGSAHLDYSRDDVGNAQRLVREHRHDIRHVDALGGWLVWSEDEKRWVVDGTGEVSRRAIGMVRNMEAEAQYIEDTTQRAAFLKFVRSSSNIGKLRAMVSLAADMKDITIPAREFDADAKALCVAGGVVELHHNPGVVLKPAVRERYLMLSTGTRYRPGAKAPEWDEFLEHAQPDKAVRRWLQKLVGYSLYGGNPKRLFIVCFGPTSTGKTTFAEALRSALGDYAATVNLTVFRDNQDERARADICDVLGKRLVYAEEASASWHLHPDQVKRITGGAPMKARRPFAKDYIEAVPAFTPWMLTNSPPTIEGADNAFWRRLRVVPWRVPVSAAAEDIGLRARLMSGEAREGVLAWALRGWEMYARNPDLEQPAATLEVFAEFVGGVSDFDRFVRDCCEIDPELCVRPEVLYRAYQLWCGQNGTRPKSNTEFGKFLAGRGWARRQTKKLDGVPRWVREGLDLNPEWCKISGG